MFEINSIVTLISYLKKNNSRRKRNSQMLITIRHRTEFYFERYFL